MEINVQFDTTPSRCPISSLNSAPQCSHDSDWEDVNTICINRKKAKSKQTSETLLINTLLHAYVSKYLWYDLDHVNSKLSGKSFRIDDVAAMTSQHVQRVLSLWSLNISCLPTTAIRHSRVSGTARQDNYSVETAVHQKKYSMGLHVPDIVEWLYKLFSRIIRTARGTEFVNGSEIYAGCSSF